MSQDHAWMSPALELMFDTVDVDRVRAALMSDEQRKALRSELNQALVNPDQIPNGQYADNLLRGLLALRMKFDRTLAMQKLASNLAKRSQWSP